MIELVTYDGPAGGYRVPDFEGAEYVLRRGVPTPVPDALAEHLIGVEGHDFEVGEAQAPEISEPVEDENEQPIDEEDPEGVNAESPYGEE